MDLQNHKQTIKYNNGITDILQSNAQKSFQFELFSYLQLYPLSIKTIINAKLSMYNFYLRGAEFFYCVNNDDLREDFLLAKSSQLLRF